MSPCPFSPRFARHLAAAALALGLTLAVPVAGHARQTVSDSVGLRYLQSQQYEKAAEFYRALTQREPENGPAWYRLGIALQDGGDPAAAIAPLENWTDFRGRSGKSINFYNRQTGAWRQVWVTDQGNVLDYDVGRIVDGAMVYEGTTRDAYGTPSRRRMVLTPVSSDTVRQEMFNSSDGSTWTSVWLGIYVRRSGGTPQPR